MKSCAGGPGLIFLSVGADRCATINRNSVETFSDGKKSQTAEVITLSLTFDHRVVNGVGAANFVHEVKEQIESFAIPAGAAARTK